MAQFPIDIKIDTGESRKLTPLNRELDRTDSSATGATTAVKALSGALVALGAGTAVKRALSVNLQFNKSISELSAITGATGRDLRTLTEASKEFGATTTLSASQAAAAFKLIASAKPDLLTNVDALQAVTAEAITLAEAAGIDLPNAANALGNALNQFGAEADQANRFINVLAAGAKFGSSSIQDTSDALRDAGVSAANANVSFEETNAAIQALATSGIRGARAGTGLRNVLTILDTATDEQLRPSVVGLGQALENLAAQQLDNTEFVKLFGRENQNAARILLNQRDNFKSLTQQLTGTNTAFEQASTRTDNLAGDLLALNSAFEGVQIEAAQLADETLRDLTQALTAGLQDLNENPEQIADALRAIGTAAEYTATLLAGRFLSSVATSTKATVTKIAATRNAAAAELNAARATEARAVAELRSIQIAAQRTAGFVLNKKAVDALAAAEARATAATTTLTAAQANYNRVATAGGFAIRGLSGALALVGGPVGAAALAAFAIYDYTSSIEDSEEVQERYKNGVAALATEFENLSDNVLGTKLKQAQADYNELNKESIDLLKQEARQIAARDKALDDGGAVAAADEQKALRETQKQIEANRAARAELQKTIDAGFSVREQEIEQGFKAAEADQKAAEAKAEVAAGNTTASDSYTKLASSLQEQIIALETSEEAAENYRVMQQLGTDATQAQIAAVVDLRSRILELQEAQRAESDLQQFDQQQESPIERIQREADELREANRTALDANLQQQQEYAERELEIDRYVADQKKKIQQSSQSKVNQATAQGLDALAGIISAAGGKSTAAYRAIFAASRAFALADAIAKVAQAQAQALADPTAVTLPQKIANYTAVATAGAGLISSLQEPEGFADGGLVSGPGTGRSDDIPAWLSNGEFVMPAQRTGQYRQELEAMRNGSYGGRGGSNVTIVNNVSDRTEVTTTDGPDGELIATIDERIADRTPGIVADELGDPYSQSTKTLNARYRLERN